MTLLSGCEWRTSYRHEDGHLSYFSADAMALAARGIDAHIANDGRMRLIVGCTLQQPEQDAIGEGYDWRARLSGDRRNPHAARITDLRFGGACSSLPS